MKVTYIKGAKLDWPNLWDDLKLERDKGGRWYASDESPLFVQDYCSQYRTPSRAWPYSHAKPLLTAKFARLLCDAEPELALELGIARKEA